MPRTATRSPPPPPPATAAPRSSHSASSFGVVLGDIEESTDVRTWRNPTDTIRRYFAFLAANGYTLSEVEQIAGGVKKPRKPRATRNVAAA